MFSVTGWQGFLQTKSIKCDKSELNGIELEQAGGSKKVGSFWKKTYILPVPYLVCSAKEMLFQLLIYYQNKGAEVRFYYAISMYIYVLSVVIMCVCSYLYLLMHEYL